MSDYHARASRAADGGTKREWREPAPAKVNLALHVTARRADGYHLLDSIVAFADYGDVLLARPAQSPSLSVEGPFAASLPPAADNLVLRAAAALRERWPEHYGGCAFVLKKNLPPAAGIGGGSADAAAALRAMSRLHGPPPGDEPEKALAHVALALGADVPVCLAGRTARMRGIGEDIAALPGFPPLPAVLANPGVAVSTAAVFDALSLAPGAPAHPPLPDVAPPPGAGAAEWIAWLGACRNDLQSAAIACAPAVGACLDALAALPGARLVRMSGSGATCFALFADAAAAEAAAVRLRRRRPDWWVRAVTLGDAPAGPAGGGGAAPVVPPA